MKDSEKIQFTSFSLHFDALKRTEEIIWENAFEQKYKKPGLKFNPELAINQPSNNLAQISVVVNFLSQLIFIFLKFLGIMVMYANEFETKEK